MEFSLSSASPPSWAASPRTPVTLVCEKAGSKVEEYTLRKPMTIVGRSKEADINLAHESISRKHAAIICHKEGTWWVVDLRSAHKSFLDKRPLRPGLPTPLQEDKVLKLGGSTRSFRLLVRAVKVEDRRRASRSPVSPERDSHRGSERDRRRASRSPATRSSRSAARGAKRRRASPPPRKRASVSASPPRRKRASVSASPPRRKKASHSADRGSPRGASVSPGRASISPKEAGGKTTDVHDKQTVKPATKANAVLQTQQGQASKDSAVQASAKVKEEKNPSAASTSQMESATKPEETKSEEELDEQEKERERLRLKRKAQRHRKWKERKLKKKNRFLTTAKVLTENEKVALSVGALGYGGMMDV